MKDLLVLTSPAELAASSSQNSLPGGSSESQPVVCGDLGPLLVLLRTHCQAAV